MGRYPRKSIRRRLPRESGHEGFGPLLGGEEHAIRGRGRGRGRGKGRGRALLSLTWVEESMRSMQASIE